MSSIPQFRPGPNRVKAWVYTIINPLIDSLRRELFLLQQGNLSWRYHSQRLEYIRSLKDYIETDVLPNLEDFLTDNPDFCGKFESHDQRVASLEERATAFYKRLLTSSIFNKDVNSAFDKYETTIISTEPYAQSIESIREHLPKFVAENLINNAHELPAHYTIHSFWKSFAKEFQKHLTDFQEYKGRQSFHEVVQAADALKEASSSLLHSLESRRNSLCREFDIPAAPVPVARTTPEYMF